MRRRQFIKPLLAQSRHAATEFQCPLSGVKRKLIGGAPMSAFDPKRTLSLAASCAFSQSDRSLIAPRERQSVRAVPDVNQGIIRFLDPIGQLTWQEQQFLLHLCAVGHRLVDGQDAQLHYLAVVRPGYCRSFVESPAAASCALRWNVTGPRLRRSGSSSIRKFGGCFAASDATRCTTRSGTI